MTHKPLQRDKLIAATFKALTELGGSGTNAEIIETVIKNENYSEEITDEPQAGHPGRTKLEYELAWARTYLKNAGIIENVGYRIWAITPEFSKKQDIDPADVVKIMRNKSDNTPNDSIHENTESVPDEYADQDWRIELSEKLRVIDPYGFERLSMRLLRESGFDEVSVTKKSGDGGIDGFGILKINDLFGIKVAFQCKRYNGNKITAEDIRQFRGTLPANIERGIFITTGQYTRAAIDEAKRSDVKNIDLINGDQFIDKLAQYEIGCKKVETYKINKDFFESI